MSSTLGLAAQPRHTRVLAGILEPKQGSRDQAIRLNMASLTMSLPASSANFLDCKLISSSYYRGTGFFAEHRHLQKIVTSWMAHYNQGRPPFRARTRYS